MSQGQNANSQVRNQAELQGPKIQPQLRDHCCAFFSASGFQIASLLLGLLIITGCGKPHGKVLGKAPKGEVRTILAVRAGDTPPQVIVDGIMIEKCPVAGCWFRLRDRTGTIKVDTKSAGFAVVDIPLDTKVMVAGKVVLDGNDTAIEATGLRY